MADVAINPAECFLDSPFFRSQLGQLETTTSDLEGFINTLSRTARSMVDAGYAYQAKNEAFARDLQRFAQFEQSENRDAVEIGLSRVGETLDELEGFRKNLMHETELVLTQPLEDFLRTEILSGTHELKKRFQKTNDDYDSALFKYLGRKASTPQNVLNESAQEVCDSRRAFHHSSVEYVSRLNELHAKNKFEFLEKVIAYVLAQHRYFHQGYEMLKDLLPYVKQLTVHVQEARMAYERDAAERAAQKARALQEATTWYHPYKTVTPMAGRHPFANFAKEGYLLKKAQGGVAGVMQSWDRRYFGIKNDLLLYYNRSKPDDEPTVATNLKLCTVKAVDPGERRFALQVISPIRSYTLQAESDEDQMAWITTLQTAIANSLQGNVGNEELSNFGMTRLKKKERVRRTLLQPSSAPSTPSLGSPSYSNSTEALSASGSSERVMSPPTDEVKQQLLATLHAVPGNERCADCGKEGPEWSSINYGAMLCIECSGIHRSLGTHVSKVRSALLDKWEPELVSLMLGIGNEAVNRILLATLPASAPRAVAGAGSTSNPFEGDDKAALPLVPAPDSPRPVKEAWIAAKYRDRRFAVAPPANADAALAAAMRAGDLQVALRCLVGGGSPVWRDVGEGGMTTLHACIESRNLAGLELVLQWTFDVDVPDDNNVTPLFYCVLKGELRAALMLVRRGAQWTKPSAGGQSPAEFARSMQHSEFVALFKALDDVQQNPNAVLEIDGETFRVKM